MYPHDLLLKNQTTKLHWIIPILMLTCLTHIASANNRGGNGNGNGNGNDLSSLDTNVSDSLLNNANKQSSVDLSTSLPQVLLIESSEVTPLAAPAIAPKEWKLDSRFKKLDMVTQGRKVSWAIHSNNAFIYRFSANSVDDTGAVIDYPQFAKRSVDASGKKRAKGQNKSYRNLATFFGVKITDYDSVERVDEWGGGDIPIGDAKQLIRNDNGGAPSQVTGRVMPGDATSRAVLNLYTIGLAEEFVQSGLYEMELTLTVTAEEQLN